MSEPFVKKIKNKTTLRLLTFAKVKGPFFPFNTISFSTRGSPDVSADLSPIGLLQDPTLVDPVAYDCI